MKHFILMGIFDFVGDLTIPIIMIMLVLAFLLVMKFISSRYKKIPPGKAGVFYGKKGIDVITGGGRILWPFVQEFQEMSTTVFQVDVSETNIPNKDTVKITAKGIATCKISTIDTAALKAAANAFLGKSGEEVERSVKNILIGHLRSIIGKMNIEELLRERDKFNGLVIAESENELKKLGLGEYESKVYLSLLKHGSLDGKTLSKLSAVPQSKIYEILYGLSDKRFVSVLDVKPKRFKAIEPELAVKHYLRLQKEKIEELEKTLPTQLKSIKKIPAQKPEEMITVYRGKKNTHPLVIGKFITAQKYVKDMFTFDYLPASVLREIEHCIQRGVRIQMLATKKSKESLALMKKARKN